MVGGKPIFPVQLGLFTRKGVAIVFLDSGIEMAGHHLRKVWMAAAWPRQTCRDHLHRGLREVENEGKRDRRLRTSRTGVTGGSLAELNSVDLGYLYQLLETAKPPVQSRTLAADAFAL